MKNAAALLSFLSLFLNLCAVSCATIEEPGWRLSPRDARSDTLEDPAADITPDPAADPAGDTGRDNLSAPRPDGGLDISLDSAPDAESDPGEDEETWTGVYGMIDADFSTHFILDGMRFEDPDYTASHMDSILGVAAFSGDYSMGKYIPNIMAMDTQSFAIHYPADYGSDAAIIVGQQSMDGYGEPANPFVQFTFPSDSIAPTTYSVDLMAGDAILYVFNVTEMYDLCILAVGMGGAITVTEAENTEADDGGRLTFSGRGIPIYHPASTPYGDISYDFTSMGMSVCPLE
ncbi:MAG: hypothetical protein ABIJ56_01170 [Pseudomonadota bacterium]